MAFRRRSKAPDPDHPEPVEIDLGVLPDWQIGPLLASLEASGYRMQVYSPSDAPQHGLPRHHRILAHPDDAELIELEILERLDAGEI